jgi:serine/threonine protein kinase
MCGIWECVSTECTPPFHDSSLTVYRLGGPKCGDPKFKTLFSSLRFHRSETAFEMLLEEALGTDGASPYCLDFLRLCLQTAPDARPSASELLQHPFVRYTAPYLVANPRPTAVLEKTNDSENGDSEDLNVSSKKFESRKLTSVGSGRIGKQGRFTAPLPNNDKSGKDENSAQSRNRRTEYAGRYSCIF